MSACNERPPEGHPFYGSGVACHLAAGHRGPHSWALDVAPLTWAARFRDGPAAGSPDRAFVVGPVWRWIRVAEVSAVSGWVIVGGEPLDPEDMSEEPRWPGEVHYELAEIEPYDDEFVDRLAWYVEESGGE